MWQQDNNLNLEIQKSEFRILALKILRTIDRLYLPRIFILVTPWVNAEGNERRAFTSIDKKSTAKWPDPSRITFADWINQVGWLHVFVT